VIVTSAMALSGMWIQSITYRGRLVAGATERGLFLCGRLASRPVSDPERTFVIYMALFAADVLRGVLPGLYTDERARRYARAALIPGELLEHDLPHLNATARALPVPAEELRQARTEHERRSGDRDRGG
jgi:hypothetical protein